MSTNEFDNYWEDKANWKYGLFYNCSEDPRVIVPKRPKWAGRTFNFAHRRAYWLLLAIILLTSLSYAIMMAYPIMIICFIILVGCIVIFCYSTDLRVDKPNRRIEK
jgi:uncharacterized membrane protein